MRFLCVACDQQMMLESTMTDPVLGALTVRYSCSQCGNETAMLTNPAETQLLHSLGVRVGPKDSAPSTAPGSGCPFAAMMSEQGAGAGEPGVHHRAAPEAGMHLPRWSVEANARLERVPEFVRPMARLGVEKFAADRGYAEITIAVLEEARGEFGF